MMNQIKYFVFFTLILVLFSCGYKAEEIPENLIPKAKMIDVIAEIELTQALVKLKFSTQDTVNQKQLFNEVYIDFDISQEQFNSSLEYYCKDPKLFMNMYEQVIEKLSQKQSEQLKK